MSTHIQRSIRAIDPASNHLTVVYKDTSHRRLIRCQRKLGHVDGLAHEALMILAIWDRSEYHVGGFLCSVLQAPVVLVVSGQVIVSVVDGCKVLPQNVNIFVEKSKVTQKGRGCLLDFTWQLRKCRAVTLSWKARVKSRGRKEHVK